MKTSIYNTIYLTLVRSVLIVPATESSLIGRGETLGVDRGGREQGRKEQGREVAKRREEKSREEKEEEEERRK